MKNTFMKLEGFEDALVGFDNNCQRYIYSIDLILELLMKDGMSYEEADEHFYQHINKTCTGDFSPIIMNRI
jgi:hypothetical protein